MPPRSASPRQAPVMCKRSSGAAGHRLPESRPPPPPSISPIGRIRDKNYHFIMAKVRRAGLNPAWQKILEFDAFAPGEVNRATALVQLASGKGLNAAKVLSRLGHEVHLLQVLGGSNGQRCLVACQALGLHSL